MIDRALELPLLAGVLGACVGSFLNVVIYRLPREDVSIGNPRRSFCPSCRRPIPWRENLPILSWLLLGGRCRGCRAEIPVRYLFVEALTAFLFAAWAHWHGARGADGAQGWIVLLSGLWLAAACVAVTFIDIDERIIPDEITWPGMGLGFLLSLAAPALHEGTWLDGLLLREAGLGARPAAALSSLAGILVGGGTLWLVGIAGKAVFKPKDAETGEATDAMGLGDVKYMGMVGAFLAPDGVLLVFFVACVAGALGGLLHYAVKRDRYIPFGPYLSLGILLVMFFRAPILGFLLEEWPRIVRGWIGLEA